MIYFFQELRVNDKMDLKILKLLKYSCIILSSGFVMLTL